MVYPAVVELGEQVADPLHERGADSRVVDEGGFKGTWLHNNPLPSFSGVSIVAFSLSAGMFSLFLYLTLYIQDVLEFSPLEAGLIFLPLTLLSFLLAPISARLSNRIPFRALMGAGLFLTGLGLVLMHGIQVGDSWTALLPGFLVAGAGIGMTNPGIASVAIGVVGPARAGMASGINSTFRQVGIATGVAALGGSSRAGSPQSSATRCRRLRMPSPTGLVGRRADRSCLDPATVPRSGGARRRPGVRQRPQRDHPVRRRDRHVGGVASLLLVRSRDMAAHAAAPAEQPADPAAGRSQPADRAPGVVSPAR